MTIPGRIHNGVVVLEDGSSLPEGLAVTVFVPSVAAAESSGRSHRVSLPLVRSKYPGSRPLTGDRVAELLEEDDVSPGR